VCEWIHLSAVLQWEEVAGGDSRRGVVTEEKGGTRQQAGVVAEEKGGTRQKSFGRRDERNEL
jgi:hypothetical protein